MDKSAIKTYAVEARRKLIEAVKLKARKSADSVCTFRNEFAGQHRTNSVIRNFQTTVA